MKIKKANLFIGQLTCIVNEEAKETREAFIILVKFVNFNLKLNSDKPTKKELSFLKTRSLDMVKIIPMIIMLPTPIPYIEIAILLKGLGFGFLLPNRFNETKSKIH